MTKEYIESFLSMLESIYDLKTDLKYYEIERMVNSFIYFNNKSK